MSLVSSLVAIVPMACLPFPFACQLRGSRCLAGCLGLLVALAWVESPGAFAGNPTSGPANAPTNETDPYRVQPGPAAETANAPFAELAAGERLAPPPKAIDLLVVVAHPDDESTFGALLPHYARCRDKAIVQLLMTSGEWGHGLPHHTEPDQTPDYSYDDSEQPRFEKIPPEALYPFFYREGELRRMLRISGVAYEPIFLRLPDSSSLQPWGEPTAAFELWGGKDRVVGRIVGVIRRLRPKVVVTMAYDGYNGNPQHMAASHGTIAAVEAAAEADRYPASAAEHGPYTVQKLYLAVTEGQPLSSADEAVVHHHVWTPCDDGEGRPVDVRAIAARANAEHQSQGMKNECPAATDFVLKLSTVGPDRLGENDLFENVADRPAEE